VTGPLAAGLLEPEWHPVPWTQHVPPLLTQRNTLGLAVFDSDWAAAWEHLKAVAIQALTTIREEVSTLLPD